MSLTIGSCTVDSSGTVTGTGLSAGIANAFRTALQSSGALHLSDVMTPFIGTLATQLATAIINHITATAAVTITIHTTDTGLQTSASAGNPTTGPAADKTVTGTIA